ncbi:MAG: GNAT family N-acyltransferase [Rhodospirillales bacterium]
MEPKSYKSFEVRLAETHNDVDAAQALRYQVFYEEMGAVPSLEARRLRRDCDRFDPICDHLLVIDRKRSNGKPFVVGNYRLLTRAAAKRNGGFYSAQEFDLTNLLNHPDESVELGRSCVHPEYRGRGVMPLLWRGLADYVKERNIKIFFGCGSFPGTDPRDIDTALSYLHHFHLAPRSLRPRALNERYVDMRAVPAAHLDQSTAIQELPPLIKGYLRVGGFVGDGAVVDHQFKTTDVCIIVKTDQLTAKYHRHFKPSGTPSANS